MCVIYELYLLHKRILITLRGTTSTLLPQTGRLHNAENYVDVQITLDMSNIKFQKILKDKLTLHGGISCAEVRYSENIKSISYASVVAQCSHTGWIQKYFFTIKKEPSQTPNKPMHENNWSPRGNICSPEIIIIPLVFMCQRCTTEGERSPPLYFHQ